MGRSQASPGGRCLWTERLTPSAVLTPLLSPQLLEGFRGVDGERQTHWVHVLRPERGAECTGD